MLGQPTLTTKMQLGTLAALEQRITVRRHMTGMTSEETAGYIRHHLQLVGRADPLFTEDAINLIHTSGRGEPRNINRLAISALIAACTAGKNLVDEASARSAVTENTHDHPTRDTMTTPNASLTTTAPLKSFERGYCCTPKPASPPTSPPCARSTTLNTRFCP